MNQCLGLRSNGRHIDQETFKTFEKEFLTIESQHITSIDD